MIQFITETEEQSEECTIIVQPYNMHISFLLFVLCKDRTGSMRSLPQHAADSDTWVTEYLTPSWVILPNDQPFLAIIQPGETTLVTLESVCKVNT